MAATEILQATVAAGTKAGIIKLLDYDNFWLPLFQRARNPFAEDKLNQVKRQLEIVNSYNPFKHKLEFVAGTSKANISLPSIIEDLVKEHARLSDELQRIKQNYRKENAAPPIVVVNVPPQQLPVAAPRQQNICRNEVRLAMQLVLSSISSGHVCRHLRLMWHHLFLLEVSTVTW